MIDNRQAEDELPEEVREFFDFQSKKRAMNSDRFSGNNSQTLSFRFIDVASPDRNAMPTSFVSAALRDVQYCLDYLVWSQEQGPTVFGDVPATIGRVAATEVAAISQGSFIVTIRKSEFEISDSFERAVGSFFDFMDAAERDRIDADVDAMVLDVGTEATVRLGRFFNRLGKAGAGLDLSWDGREARQAFIGDREAAALSSWLRQSTPDTEMLDVRGQLRMADNDAMRFKMTDVATDSVFEGKSDVDLAHEEIDAMYDAVIVVVTKTNKVTKKQTRRSTLKSLKKLTG